MKKEKLNDNGKLIQTGNSGEAYYAEGVRNTAHSSNLGEIECKHCCRKKPFEKVRWNDAAKAYVCLECLARTEESRHK